MNHMKMSLLRESHFSDFSLYFLASLPPNTELPDKDSPQAYEFINNMYPQVLELTHNHGIIINIIININILSLSLLRN